MAYAEERPAARPKASEQNTALAFEWRRLRRAATFVALLTAPAFFLWLNQRLHWSVVGAAAGTFIAIVGFRGFIDVVVQRFLPWPSLFGVEKELAEEDIVARRRAWYWRSKFRKLVWFGGGLLALLLVANLVLRIFGSPMGIGEMLAQLGKLFVVFLPQVLVLALQLPLLFLVNILIFLGPLMFGNLVQVRGYEPGDADWGVKMEDVRGQAEPKEEVSRVVSLWQSGEEFERLGGKRERGLLFLGAPGTGKTMLAKAIATNFACPFVTIPGSAFAATFIGVDVIVVLYLVFKAKRLARKWGGQCIIFIDEIDAVGMRRGSLGGGMPAGASSPSDLMHEYLFHGPNGALTSSGDLVLETRAWRERLFASREPERRPAWNERVAESMRGYMPFMGGGMGGLALNQLLVQMDGIGEPPFLKRFRTNRINTFLDAMYIIPPKIGKMSLRLPKPRPANEQVFFVGATNVPITQLDPALIRPGRMGRHVWFRTPTKDDRKDIFDLYMAKVAHEPDLDTERRRDELSRITNGYSPAMIEQVCSMALTYAHTEGRDEFAWRDIVEAMTTVESGTAVAIEYVPEETRAVAIHEAGHAAAGHLYLEDTLSTRLSIRKRGESLGHHQAIETQERFSSWRHEEVAKLIWTLGAMAAEHVFYEENSTGVGGDVQSATVLACVMVGLCGMGPKPIDVDGRFDDPEEAEQASEKIMSRFEKIGLQIMNRAQSGGPMQEDPVARILSDRDKRIAVGRLLGQAYLTAYCTIARNRDGVERIAETLIERRELHGDEVVEVLDEVGLRRPDIDLLDDRTWPRI